jgi:hypothetical protein
MTLDRETGEEHRLEDGTMLRNAQLVHDEQLVATNRAPGTAKLIFDRRSTRELRHADSIFKASGIKYVDSFTDADQVAQCEETLPEVCRSGDCRISAFRCVC